MATLIPFRALRPQPLDAPRVAAVPYDVVSVEEARALAEGNPLSFLRVSRAEIELPPGADPYSEAVYERAASNFARLKERAFLVEDQPSLYFYRLQMGTHAQTGLAGCFSIDEYEQNVIRKHERTRRDKEDDRTRHMIALGAQTGPVFLTYRTSARISTIAGRVTQGEPLVDFVAPDGVRHTLWRTPPADRDALVDGFRQDVPALYIADGHHRAASAARTRACLNERGDWPNPFGDAADVNTVLAVAFPHDQLQILPYNRIVKDLGELSPEEFLRGVAQRFGVEPGPAVPGCRGEIAMYFAGTWQTLRPNSPVDRGDPIGSLDVSILQDRLLSPLLKIHDVRTDKRIDFVGGARGTAALEQLVDSGSAAVAFSLFPVTVADLMTVSDAGAIMPPKSTWFEPKLRDGLLVHVI
jgi:uncharacterized protein (DUF1015 family)